MVKIISDYFIVLLELEIHNLRKNLPTHLYHFMVWKRILKQ